MIDSDLPHILQGVVQFAPRRAFAAVSAASVMKFDKLVSLYNLIS